MLTPDEKEIVKGITDRDGGRGVVVEAGMSIDKQSAGHYTGGSEQDTERSSSPLQGGYIKT